MSMDKGSLRIGKRAFLFSAAIILVLMIVSGALTKVLPSGSYERMIVVLPGYQRISKGAVNQRQGA